MSAKEQLEIYKKQIIESPELTDALYCCDFMFDSDVDIETDILNCNGKSNYEIYPFGKDSCGSNFVILNNKYVGFTSSEGGCGIIARDIKDFFNILFTCKGFEHYFKNAIFDSLEKFENKFKEINEDYMEVLKQYGNYPFNDLMKALENFIKINEFDTDISVIYEKFKSAIIIEPTFEIQCSDSNGSWMWDDVFYSEQEYVNELRKK